MASTDIDGSVIVILTTEEAQYVYDHLMDERGPYSKLEQQIIHKIARDLKLEQSDETPKANQNVSTATKSSPQRSN